ncbi:unnamed protein product, partial [Cuscuta epithymum]
MTKKKVPIKKRKVIPIDVVVPKKTKARKLLRLGNTDKEVTAQEPVYNSTSISCEERQVDIHVSKISNQRKSPRLVRDDVDRVVRTDAGVSVEQPVNDTTSFSVQDRQHGQHQKASLMLKISSLEDQLNLQSLEIKKLDEKIKLQDGTIAQLIKDQEIMAMKFKEYVESLTNKIISEGVSHSPTRCSDQPNANAGVNVDADTVANEDVNFNSDCSLLEVPPVVTDSDDMFEKGMTQALNIALDMYESMLVIPNGCEPASSSHINENINHEKLQAVTFQEQPCTILPSAQTTHETDPVTAIDVVEIDDLTLTKGRPKRKAKSPSRYTPGSEALKKNKKACHLQVVCPFSFDPFSVFK